jgi:hypothetical protein
MKATLPRPLRIPAWVPEPIARYATATYGADVGRVCQAALKSLACDRRMEGVWRELSRHACDGAFLYPARPLSAPSAKDRQNAAMLRLFNVAYTCRGLHGKTTMTRSQIEQQHNRFLAKAEELKTDALMMRMQPRLSDELVDEARAYEGYASNEERYQKLLAAAQAYEDYASELSFAGALERRHDGRGRWVALTIADTVRTLFGQPMYGLTATITSVVLGREIKRRTVQHWCTVKSPKISS